jgi:hypothetical protein
MMLQIDGVQTEQALMPDMPDVTQVTALVNDASAQYMNTTTTRTRTFAEKSDF